MADGCPVPGRGARRRRAGGPATEERGQAQLELIAAVPFVIGLGAILLQLMSVGYAQSLADGSAEAGAIALAAGAPAERAARAALPGWAGKRVDVEVRGGRVRVELRPPSLLPGLGGRLAVSFPRASWRRGPVRHNRHV